MGCACFKSRKTSLSEKYVQKERSNEQNAQQVVRGSSSELQMSESDYTPCKTSLELNVSPKDLFKLRQNWRGIKRNMEAAGVEMFVRLFKTNKDLQQLFHKFKDLETDDEIRSNEMVEQHATQVMMTIDDAITHIDNYDYVIEVLRKTGASHLRFEGFSADNFWKILDAFLHAVQVTLEDRYTENMEAIYKVAATFILQTMYDGFVDAQKAANQADH